MVPLTHTLSPAPCSPYTFIDLEVVAQVFASHIEKEFFAQRYNGYAHWLVSQGSQDRGVGRRVEGIVLLCRCVVVAAKLRLGSAGWQATAA